MGTSGLPYTAQRRAWRTVICGRCGDTFTSQHYAARFCSEACAWRARAVRHLLRERSPAIVTDLERAITELRRRRDRTAARLLAMREARAQLEGVIEIYREDEYVVRRQRDAFHAALVDLRGAMTDSSHPANRDTDWTRAPSAWIALVDDALAGVAEGSDA